MNINKNKIIKIYRIRAEQMGVPEVVINEYIHKIYSSNMKNAVKIYLSFMKHYGDNKEIALHLII